jgi:membrane-associated phospholipid phosphatase
LPPRHVRWPLVVGFGSLALFAALAAAVGEGAPFRWDQAIGDAVAALAPVSSSDVHVDPFMQGVTLAIGGLTVALGAWLVARRRFRAALFLAGAIGGAVAVSTLVKGVVERPPIEGPPDEYSFPSGSATWSLATAAVLVLLARSPRERLLAAAAGAALALGLGAVIVWEEWHYPSDVLAGWLLALGWVPAVWLALGQPAAADVDSAAGTRRYSLARREERLAAAPSVPAAERSGGTDTAA